MPTYEYQCQACGHEHEVFQSITANPLRKCPKCKKLKLKRLIGTGAGIIFKGSGFYETDYRSDSYKKAAKADSDKSSNSSESTDSKPEPAKKETTSKKEPAKPTPKAKSSDTNRD